MLFLSTQTVPCKSHKQILAITIMLTCFISFQISALKEKKNAVKVEVINYGEFSISSSIQP